MAHDTKINTFFVAVKAGDRSVPVHMYLNLNSSNIVNL